VLRWCENAAAVAGGAMMLAAMVLTTLDALMRYAFNAPLSFNYYLTENYLMVGLMTLPMAWGFRAGGFIRIMALAAVLPRSIGDALLRVGLLASALYVAALAWLAAGHFIEVWRRGDVQMGVIDWPVAWSWVWLPIGLGLLAARLTATAFGSSQRLNQMHDDTTEQSA
jgi:TRAP-type C4-dicarboxylate transport system permease small subunit